jgi:hypothetical protein
VGNCKSKITTSVAIVRYTAAKTATTEGNGRTIFLVTLVLSVLFGAVFFALQPPPYGDLVCLAGSPKGCGCPSESDGVRFRHVLIVDTTDPLRKGKYDDIERLISSIGTTPRPLWDWLVDGKRTDMTSIFVLSKTLAADMQPIAKFCAPPPRFAQYLGFKGKEMADLEKYTRKKIQDAIGDVLSASASNQSAIVETLATVVGSASHWVPGSTLVLASDLIENTPACGWFEKLSVVPPLGSASPACKTLVRSFQDGLRPNEAHKGTSVVAFCILPGKDRKPGLDAFWKEMVKGPLNSDVLYSCDPAEIAVRRKFLNPKQ